MRRLLLEPLGPALREPQRRRHTRSAVAASTPSRCASPHRRPSPAIHLPSRRADKNRPDVRPLSEPSTSSRTYGRAAVAGFPSAPCAAENPVGASTLQLPSGAASSSSSFAATPWCSPTTAPASFASPACRRRPPLAEPHRCGVPISVSLLLPRRPKLGHPRCRLPPQPDAAPSHDAAHRFRPPSPPAGRPSALLGFDRKLLSPLAFGPARYNPNGIVAFHVFQSFVGPAGFQMIYIQTKFKC